MTEPLSSWNDGSAKAAIIDFVRRTTGEGTEMAVPLEARVAVFDNDGTLWCEKPMPIQLDFVLRRLVEMAEQDPDLRNREPWRAAYERDYGWFSQLMVEHYAGHDTNIRTLAAGVLAAHADISVEDFAHVAGEFLRSAKHPTLGRGYLHTAYAPMVELLAYLETNGFTCYIASGGGRDFVRPISAEVYGMPSERGHRKRNRFDLHPGDNGGSITRQAAPDFLNDGPEKPVHIWTRTGRRPVPCCR